MMQATTRRRPRTMRWVLAAAIGAGWAAMVGVVPTASAQAVFTLSAGGPIGGGGFGRGAIDRRELKHMGEALGLDEAQRGIIASLYEGYEAACDEASAARRASIEEMAQNHQQNSNADPRALARQAMEQTRQYREQRRQMDESFLADVRGILSDEQVNSWPRYERDLRRRSSLSRGAALAGEGVDVIELVVDLDLADSVRADIAVAVDGYAEELDRALVERDRVLAEMDPARLKIENLEASDPAEMAAKFEELRVKGKAAHEKVRDVNVRFVSSLGGQLPPEAAKALREQFQRLSYPRIYRDTIADRYLRDLEGLETLNDDQQGAIEPIERAYLQRVSDLNQRLVELERAAEGKEDSPFVMSMGDGADAGGQVSFSMTVTAAAAGGGGGPVLVFGEGDDENDPRTPVRREKRQLALDTINSLFSLLTAEQQALAPKPVEEQTLDFGGQLSEALNRAIQEGGGNGRTRFFSGGEGGEGQVTGEVEVITLDQNGNPIKEPSDGGGEGGGN